MKRFQKKFLGVLLAVCTALALIPSTAVFAATSESLFVASDRHEDSETLKQVLTVAQNNTSNDISVAVMAGDMVGGETETDAPSFNLSTVQSEITSVLGSDTEVYFTFGLHDAGANTSGTNGFLEGAVDCGSYYIYGIDYYDMTSASNAQTAAAEFSAWAANADYKPIIMVSHVPLHERRGDNLGASYWMTAINAAADSHDIVFLWAHNHTEETAVDTAVYYAGVGSSIKAEGASASTPIKFTYVNAGYILEGYGTVLTISDDQILVTRYNEAGAVNTHTITRQHADAGVKTTAATCTADGSAVHTCKCGKHSYTETLPATGHNYKNANVYTSTGVYVGQKCANCGDALLADDATVNTAITTIAKATDKNWYYYKKGVVATTYTGVAKRTSNSTWWYVKNGKVSFSYTGVAKNPTNNTWWYCKKGQVIFSYTGVAKNPANNTWWYCKNGKVNFSFTGIASNPANNTRWYCKNGKVQFGYTGYVRVNGVRYRIIKGKVS